MFKLIKFLIWVVLFLVAAYFVLSFFGYEVNRDYFSGTKEECQERMKECTTAMIHNGIDHAECDLNCVDPKLIIKKK